MKAYLGVEVLLHEFLASALDGGEWQWRIQEFCSGGGSSSYSVEDRGQRERASGGGSPLVRGSGGSCNLVQEISFHTAKFSQFLVLYL